jgi:hypothetical protein
MDGGGRRSLAWIWTTGPRPVLPVEPDRYYR